MTEVSVQIADRLTPGDMCPDVHSATLGRWVVSGYRKVMAGEPRPGQLEDVIGYRMKHSRVHLAELDPEQSEMFDEICERSVPESLQEVKAAEAGTSSWQTWLGETATDEQLLEYLQWHVGSIEDQQQDPGIQEEIATQRAQFKENLRRGLAEGWLHEAAAEAIDRVDDIEVYISDVLDTSLEERLGYHTRGRDEIVIAGATSIPIPGSYEGTRRTVKDIAAHEFIHAVLGKLGVRWLNEAVTEHIAQVMKHGKLEEVEPDKRLNYSPPIYKGERRLLRHILNEGREVIPARLATLAYSAEPSGSREAFTVFRDAVNRAWNHMRPDGQQAFGELSIYVGSIERRHRLSGLSSTKATKQAMIDVYHDLEDRPEVVFGRNADQRTVVMVP